MYSIIIPCHNYEEYLEKSIDSALRQTNAQKEVIVINDCSTDNCKYIAEQYGNSIRLINICVNVGLGYARNIGVRSAKGLYVTFLDADDTLERRFVENAVKAHEKHSIVSFSHAIIDTEGEVIEYRDSSINPIIGGMSFHRKHLTQVPFQSMKNEDVHFLRQIKDTPIYFDKEVLYNYRRHGNNLSSQTYKPLTWDLIRG